MQIYMKMLKRDRSDKRSWLKPYLTLIVLLSLIPLQLERKIQGSYRRMRTAFKGIKIKIKVERYLQITTYLLIRDKRVTEV